MNKHHGAFFVMSIIDPFLPFIKNNMAFERLQSPDA